MRRQTRYANLVLTLLCTALLGTANLAHGASAAEIEARSDAAMERLLDTAPEARFLLDRAHAVLIFPRVLKAGFGVGGEYGEGVLRQNGESLEYYSTAAASIGFQLGAQARSIVIVFMTDESLNKFRNSEGWKVGIDGSVALIDIGAGKTIDSKNIKDPVVGFIFGSKGLMYNLTLEGTKIHKLDKS